MGGIIKAIVGVVVDIVDAVVDLVVDIVEIAFDLIETFIDFIVDIVEAIVDAIASLLGFGDQIVEQFEVHNQPLFLNSDRNVMSDVIVSSVINDEDIAANILYAEAFQSGKQNIKRFVKYIEDDNYFEGFADVQANILNIDYDEIVKTISNLAGAPCSISKSRLGRLTIDDWVKYWLQENKGYSLETNKLVYNGVVYGYKHAEYIEATNSYKLVFNNPSVATVVNKSAVFIGPGIEHDLQIEERLFMSTALSSVVSGADIELNLSAVFQVSPVYHVPPKPTGVAYTVRYSLDSDPLVDYLFVYVQGAGTYPDLDNSGLEFDVSTKDEIKVLPAIPLRINNANFNVTESTKTTQIRELTDKLGMDADDLIKNVMEDVADAGITDYENKVDHVFLNFGMRMWDTSQSSLMYLYRMFSLLHVAQASTEATYNSTPEADEKPYNNLMVTASNYKNVFKFAYIKSNHYTLAEVNADANSVINGVYYSDLSQFNTAGLLTKPYYVSSGKTVYNVGYIAQDMSDVNEFIAGTLARQTTYLETVKDYLQVKRRLNYSGSLKDAAGDVLLDGALKPSLVYKLDGTGLRIILRIGENVTSNQEFTYYQCVPNGLNELIVKAPIGALRVVDAATDKFKFVKSNIADEDAIMIPLSYDLVKDLPNTDITNIILASAHVSIYVAHYEVIEVSFWMKLLMVVVIVIAIMSLNAQLTAMSLEYAAAAAAGGATGIVAFVTTETAKKFFIKMLVNMIIKEAIMYVAKEVSPELAYVLAGIYAYYTFDASDTPIDFVDATALVANSADLIGNIFNIQLENDYELMDKRNEDILKEYNDSINYIKSIYQEMGLSIEGDTLSLVGNNYQAEIIPKLPDPYFKATVTEMHDYATNSLYDQSGYYDGLYDIPLYSN